MGRGVSPQIPNCHVPYKEEAARGKHAKKEATKSSKKGAGIPIKKEGNPVEVKRKGGYHESPRKLKSLTLVFQATHELGGLTVEV